MSGPASQLPAPGGGEFLLYQAADGRARIEVRFSGETVWLTQAQLAELFQRERSVIAKHILNIFADKELNENSVCAKYAQTAADGKTYQIAYYNLDVIISVGYRVKSPQGTQFRIWATQRLREFITKGFTLDDERLKRAGGGRYFEELLARIRDIRSSEKMFWRKVLEIYATSIDYDPGAKMTQTFFQTVQNKMHWAAHGHTAAEIIARRAGQHGFDELAWLSPPQIGRRCRQELSERRRVKGVGPHRDSLSGICRTSGLEPEGDAHGGMDFQAG